MSGLALILGTLTAAGTGAEGVCSLGLHMAQRQRQAERGSGYIPSSSWQPEGNLCKSAIIFLVTDSFYDAWVFFLFLPGSVAAVRGLTTKTAALVVGKLLVSGKNLFLPQSME